MIDAGGRVKSAVAPSMTALNTSVKLDRLSSSGGDVAAFSTRSHGSMPMIERPLQHQSATRESALNALAAQRIARGDRTVDCTSYTEERVAPGYGQGDADEEDEEDTQSWS
jgi:hypothetical protein